MARLVLERIVGEYTDNFEWSVRGYLPTLQIPKLGSHGRIA